MAKQGVLRRVTVLLRVLFVASPLFVLDYVAAVKAQGPQFLLGLAAWFGVVIVSTGLTMAVAVGLRARLVWLALGAGPTLSLRVSGNRLQSVRALPIVVTARFVTGPVHFGRDYRIIGAAGQLFSVGLSAVAALVLPGYAATAVVLMTGLVLVLTMATRDPDSGRFLSARVLLPPTARNDPALARPDRGVAAQARMHAQFGDFAEAEAILETLRSTRGAGYSTALVTAELLAARGDYDNAARVRFPRPDPDEAPALAKARRESDSARIAKLLLLAVERDPSLAPKAVPLAKRHLDAVGEAPGGDYTARTLFSLQSGDLRAAQTRVRICTARGRMPLAAADALCSRARLEVLRGRPAKAARALNRAARIAPWYPRIDVVRWIAGAGAAAAFAALPVADPSADTSYVFAEPWSVPTPDEG